MKGLKIGASLLAIVILGSFQAITIPIIADSYTSPYFILLLNGIEFFLLFSIFTLFVFGRKIPLPNPRDMKSLIFVSVYSTMTSIGLYYSSSPLRTPVVMQSVLQSLVIIPSVIFTKLLINKPVKYKKHYIMPSLLLLVASVVVTAIPLTSHWSLMGFVWICIYISGKVSRSAFNVYQEKYLRESHSGLSPFEDKVLLGFYSRLLQLILTGCTFWIEYIIGYSDHPWIDFRESVEVFFEFGVRFWILESFVISFAILYAVSIYLNSISTNYNMIASVATNPASAIFFMIFSDMNPGVKIPLEFVIPGLVCGAFSVVLWVLGEEKLKYRSINDVDDSDYS